jgi:ATP-binding cassette, subfamily B, bacterial
MLAFLRKKPAEKSVDPKPVDQPDEEQRYKPIEISLLKRLFAQLKPYKRLYVIGYSLGFVHLVLEMLNPKFIGWITDHVAAHYNGTSNLTDAGALRILFILIGLWVVAFVASVLFNRAQILFVTRGGESVQFDLREKLFKHLQELSMSYYDKTKLGRIISRMTSDIGAVRDLNVWGIWHMISCVTQITFASIMLLWVDWRMFLCLLPVAAAIFVLNRIYVKRMASVWQTVREGFTRVSTNLAENINGMRVVAAFNRQEPNLDAFNDLQKDNTRNNINANAPSAAFQQSLFILGFTGKAIILAFGAYLIVTGQQTLGTIVAATFYWDWFIGPIQFLGGYYNTLLQGMASAERIFSLLDLKPDVADSPDAKPLPPIVGRVTFEEVTFGYNADRPVLHNVNFQALPGQTIALVGSTGSGKSSIISLIARFYQPQQGRVLVDGHDIRHCTGESLHKQMGLVLQSNYLFTGTVMENIRYAKPDATPDQVKQAARELGTIDAIESLKNGFDTDVGERGSNMSLGQRQLICFTRAYLANPRIFMLDEATSAVDTHTEAVIQESLEKLTKGRTTFIVAHRLSTIMKADLIMVIDQGHIIERGTHSQLVAAGGKYASLYEQFSSGSH